MAAVLWEVQSREPSIKGPMLSSGIFWRARILPHTCAVGGRTRLCAKLAEMLPSSVAIADQILDDITQLGFHPSSLPWQPLQEAMH